MSQRIKKHWDLALIGTAAVFLVAFALVSGFPSTALGNVTNNVQVTATVQQYLTFTASATSTTLSPDLVDNSGNPHVASSSNITFTVNTSSPGGFSVTVAGGGNGLASTTNYIYTSTATGTIVAGTNGYGLQASSTNAGMTIYPNFDWPFTGTTVGSASSSSAVNLASESSPASDQTFDVRFLAAATTSMPAAQYQDTVTFTALPTP